MSHLQIHNLKVIGSLRPTMGKYRIREFDRKHIFVEFIVFEDFIKVWIMKSSMIGGFRGRFFQWDCGFMPNIESFIAPIWVHLPHFPLYLFDEKSIISVASVFGKPIFIESSQKVGMLSVCVAKDVRVKGPSDILVEFVGDGIIVDRFTQLVNYGEIPDYCDNCLHMGHNSVDCKVLAKNVEAAYKRLKVVENCEVPIVSVFNRIHEDMSKKCRLRDNLVKDLDSVLVEDVTDREEEGCGLSPRQLNLGDKTEPIAYSSSPDSLTAPSLETPSAIAGPVDQGELLGISLLVSKLDDRPGREVFSAGEERVLLGANPAETVQSADPVSVSSTGLTSKSPFSISEAVVHIPLVGDTSMVYKVDSRASELMVTVEEVPVLSGGKAADEPHNSVAISDRSTAISLEHHNLHPEADVHGSKAGDICLISKVVVPSVKAMETTREDHIFVAETSVAEPLAADQILSMSLNSSFVGTPSFGSLEGTSGGVLRWLGKQVGMDIQEKLQQKRLDHGENDSPEISHKATLPSQKIVIKDPVTKEVVHLSPKSNSPVDHNKNAMKIGLTKNAKKKLRKKQKKKDLLLSSSGQGSIDLIANSEVGNEHISTETASPLPTCVSSKQDWEGLDSNGSKDSPFWANYHAAQVDLSQLDRPEAYPYMFQVESEEEQLDFSSDSHMQPLSSSSEVEELSSSSNSQENRSRDSFSSSDTSLECCNVFTLQKAYQIAAASIDSEAIEECSVPRSPQAALEVVEKKTSSSDAITKVEVQVTKKIEEASSHDLEDVPSSQEEVQEVEADDLLPLLEAYHKGHFDVQVTPSKETEDASSSHDLVAVEAEQVTPSNACINETVKSPPSTQISWAQEVETADALTVGDLYETIPYDKELVIISGGGVVSYPCPWINSEDRDLLPEEHDLIHKLVTQYPFKNSMSGVPIERWYQVDVAKASKKFHKEQFEPP